MDQQRSDNSQSLGGTTLATATSSLTAAMAEEFARHYQEAHRILWLIAVGIVCDRTLADDVVQEAALVALTKWDQFRAGTSFSAWMGQIVRFVALNTARSEKKRRGAGMDSSTLEHLAPPAPEEPDVRWVSVGADGALPDDQRCFDDDVMQALGSLSDVARSCLLLRVLEGLEYSEISRVLDIPEGTAMSHVHRSRKVMRQRLAQGEQTGSRKAL